MLEIWIELGCSIVGDVGIIIYIVGFVKDIFGIWKYVLVDGGMIDNLRFVLYNVCYEVMLVNWVNDENEEFVLIVGKCCESGDMLIWDIYLLKVVVFDLLVVFCIGVYGYLMVNNYNWIWRLVVVFVKGGIL